MAIQSFGPELTAKNMQPLVDRIHDGGAVAAIQLIPVPLDQQRTDPADLTKHAITSLLRQYQIAAEMCMTAGFDGLEIHGAHGFVLNRFFSPEHNKRRDEFGGSLIHRMRLAVEIVTALRSTCGDDMLLFYRHTPVGYGYGVHESGQFARKLIRAGVDILDLSPSSVEYPGDRATPFTQFGVPVIAVGQLHDVTRSLEVLTEHRANFVAIGRGLIADPEWPNKVKAGRIDKIVACLGCNTHCYGNLEKNLPIECARWTT
jgi:2,4-dienoyl-CoA reductase-like NADH-dependent reductase (Old Yellow Enzyme family)